MPSFNVRADRFEDDVGKTPARRIDLGALRASGTASSFMVVGVSSGWRVVALRSQWCGPSTGYVSPLSQDGPSDQERLIMRSTLCSNLTRIRQLMKDLGGDVDSCIEVLIASQEDDDDGEEGDGDGGVGVGAPSSAAVPSSVSVTPSAAPVAAKAPVPSVACTPGKSVVATPTVAVAAAVSKWSCPTCTFWNGAYPVPLVSHISLLFISSFSRLPLVLASGFGTG